MRTVGILDFSKLRALLSALAIVLAIGVSTAFAQATVTASWDRNTDANTAGYRLYYGTTPGSYQWSVDAGNQVSVPIPLSRGSVYYFVVRAYNASFEYGPPSSEARVDLTTPAPTAQITATMQSATAALVSWQTTNAVSATINGAAVATSGTTTVNVAAPTTFTLRATAADGRIATASASVTPTAAPTAQITASLQAGGTALVSWQTANAVSASINGVSVGLSGSASVPISSTTTYTITAVGASGAQATASATVVVQALTAPGSPRSMSASVAGSRATLLWLAPNTGGAPSAYLLSVGTSSGASNVTSNYNVGNLLSVYGDLPRGTYYARVRATNGAGTSLNSNEVRFTIGRRLRTPTGLRVTWQGTTATLSWTASAADAADDVPTNYVLEAGTVPGEANVARVSVGNRTVYSVEVPSGSYFVRVRAENAEGESDPSDAIEVTAPGAPQAPTGLLSLTNQQGAVVDLSWNAPAGGYVATGYVIEAGSAPGLADLARVPVGNVTRFTTTAPPGVYYVRVRGMNARGLSLPSNEIVVRR